MNTSEVRDFIKRQRQRGLDRNAISELLSDSPWPKEIIGKALTEEFIEDSALKHKILLLKKRALEQKKQYYQNRYLHKHHFYTEKLEQFKQRQDADAKRDDVVIKEEEEYNPVKIEKNDLNDGITISADKINIQSQESRLDALQNISENLAMTGPGEGEYRNPVMLEQVELTKVPKGNRVQTGIPGFDSVIEGGFTKKSATMVAGGPGTGKSTLGLQYIYNGAAKFDEPGVYITFEQQTEALMDQAEMFGWDMKGMINKKKVVIHEYTPEQLDKMLIAGGGSFRDLIDSIQAKRIVIDSLTAFMLLYEGEVTQRRACLGLFHNLAKWGCTSMMIVEEEHKHESHKSSVLEYETDAVIVLYNERRGDIRQRSLEVFKMRGTKHAGRIFPIKLTSEGIAVYPDKVVKAV